MYSCEQIKAISSFGENEDVQVEIAEYKEQMRLRCRKCGGKINKGSSGRPAKMPEEQIRTYIDSLFALLLWANFTKDNFDIDKAQDVLDKDHYAFNLFEM